MQDALLLLGPTGSGKTPLGRALEARGLSGRPCRHFDFGAALRAAAGAGGGPLGPADRRTVREVLASGRLLEDHEFGIARRLLDSFLAADRGGRDALVVLNGLPRHDGQARALEDRLGVRAVACLNAPAPVLAARIRLDVGGDRAGRTDDVPEAIAARLERFRTRTAPLIRHYEREGARIVALPVGVETTVDALHEGLAAAWAR